MRICEFMENEMNPLPPTDDNNIRMPAKDDKDLTRTDSAKSIPAERQLLLRLGETIQKKRLSMGLSQEQVCSIMNMNRTYLSDVERGVSNPSFLVLWRIAFALKLELWQIIKDADFGAQKGAAN